MSALDSSFLSWPFFDEAHRRFASELERWAQQHLGDAAVEERDIDGLVRDLAVRLGAAGWLRFVVPRALGGISERLDVRSLCLIREILARHSGIADFTFAMQGLGSGPITLFGSRLSELQAPRMRISDMAVEIDAAALLVYRAAWVEDTGAERVTREASMAKLYATEAAQRMIDSAVQLFGGLDVTSGSTVERRYREIRPLRIYEGISGIQKLVIAAQVLGTD